MDSKLKAIEGSIIRAVTNTTKEFLEATRVVVCGQNDCIYNGGGTCRLNKIWISEDDKPICRMYKPKEQS